MSNTTRTEVLSEVNEDVQSFLKAFFDVEDALNRVDYEKALEGRIGLYKSVRRWIEPLRGETPQPTVLPRVVEKQGEPKTWWYGVAQGDAQLRHLVEEVRAFVGPSYSNFRGQRARLHGDRDPIEKAIQDFTGGAALRFRGDAKKVRAALNLMHATRERREQRAPSVPRSKGLVLRDFHTALEAGNRGAARETLQYIKERSLLNALNRRFLRIQMLHHFREWEEMLALDLEDVLSVRRPMAVTEALVQAVYHNELASFEEKGDAKGAREHFWEAVHPQYAALYDVRSRMRSPEVLKSFMLEASGENSTTDPNRLLEEARKAGVADDFLRKLAPEEKSRTTPDEEVPLPERARTAYEAGEYDRAFALATTIFPPTPQKARLLLKCATELQNTEADSEAVEAVHELDEGGREAVLQNGLMRMVYKSLLGRAELQKGTPSVPTSWIAWLERLADDADWKRQRAIELAERGRSEWSVADLAANPGGASRMAELLAVLIDERQRALMRSLPHLIGALREDPAFPNPELAEVYEHFLLIIALSDRVSESHLALFNEMARAVLRLGAEKKRYASMVTTTKDLWDQEESPVHADWVLDFLDLLVIYPTKAEEAQLRLLTRVAQGLKQFKERLEREQLVFFQRLCRELGHPDAASDFSLPGLEEEGETDPLTKLAGQKVAIYTLDENAGRRAQRLVNEACAEADVRLNHEKQGSAQLRSLARNADYFVIVTGSAKHAATEYIEAKRRGQPILYPVGTGSSSILRELRDGIA